MLIYFLYYMFMYLRLIKGNKTILIQFKSLTQGSTAVHKILSSSQPYHPNHVITPILSSSQTCPHPNPVLIPTLSSSQPYHPNRVIIPTLSSSQPCPNPNSILIPTLSSSPCPHPNHVQPWIQSYIDLNPLGKYSKAKKLSEFKAPNEKIKFK